MKVCVRHLVIFWVSMIFTNMPTYAEVVVEQIDQNEQKTVLIKLDSGDIYIGQLSCKEKTCVIVTSKGPIKFTKSRLVSVEENESKINKLQLELDRNRTRYLISSSALSLKSFETYISQRHLVYSTFQMGITDEFMAGVGSILPTISWGEVFLMPSLKYGRSINENWHWAIGLEGLVMPGDLYGTSEYDTYSTLFVGTTYNAKDFQIGFNTGTAVGSEDHVFLNSKYFLFSLAATYHISAHLDLVTDHVVLYMNGREPSSASYHGYVFRMHGSHLSVDLGLMSFTHSRMRLPWLDLTWNF